MGFALRPWSKNKDSKTIHYLNLSKSDGISVEMLQNTRRNSRIISCIQYLSLEVENISIQEGK